MLYVVDGERRFVHSPWRDLPISRLIDALTGRPVPPEASQIGDRFKHV